MVSTDSIFIRRHIAISIVCTILIIYPNLMWMPWNVAALQPGELVAFWATAIYRCIFFFCLFYFQIGFNLNRLSDTRFFTRRWKNLLFSLVGAVVFIAVSIIRANKQFIIAHDAIKDLIVWFDNSLKVILHTETPEPIYVSKNRVTEFKEWLIS